MEEDEEDVKEFRTNIERLRITSNNLQGTLDNEIMKRNQLRGTIGNDRVVVKTLNQPEVYQDEETIKELDQYGNVVRETKRLGSKYSKPGSQQHVITKLVPRGASGDVIGMRDENRNLMNHVADL